MTDRKIEREGISRRDFLVKSGAAFAAGAIGSQSFGSLAAAAEAARAGKIKGNGFDRAGIWLFHPSIFEYSLGPWQPSLPSNPDLVTLWKQTIDWYADNGLDFIVLHIAPYGGDANPSPIRPDQVRFGWGYHYVIDFKKFPEGKVFKDDFVKRNQDIVRAVTEYGKEKGVDVFYHHYNFMMTKPFLDAHPDLMRFEYLKKGNFVDLVKDQDEGRKNYPDFPINPHSSKGDDLPWAPLILNVCWNKPLYRDYMVACFQEYFEQFPAAAGILVTPGERALCQCIYCNGEHPDSKAAMQNRYGDCDERRKTISNFAEVFSKTLKDMGKTPLVRSWINGVVEAPEKWAKQLPKGTTYVTKYSVFDMTNSGVDPLTDFFLKEGHDVWLMKEYVGGENAGNIVETIPGAFDMIAGKCREKGVKGVMGVDNAEWGYTFKSRRVQYVPEILFANSFGHLRKGSPDNVAEREYKDIFGKNGKKILKAIELSSHLPFNIDRVMGTTHEGFTWGFSYHFAPFPNVPKKVPPRQEGWPGSLGEKDLDPPKWLRREVVSFMDYVNYAQSKPWTETFRKELTGDGKDPIVFLEGFMADSKKGLEAMKKLAPKVSEEAKPEMEILMWSSELSYLTAVRYVSFLTSRLYYAGACGPNTPDKKKELANVAVAEYEKGLKATEEMAPILDSMPASVVDPSTAKKYKMMDVEKRRRELGFLKTDLASVLGETPPQQPAAVPSGGGRAAGRPGGGRS